MHEPFNKFKHGPDTEEGYLNMLNYTDWALGQFINNFKTRNREYKRSCHESSIRVPTSLIGNVFQQGGRIKELTNILDIHATILDLAKVKNTSHCDGRSVLPLVNKTSKKWENEIFIQISESQLA